MLFPLGICAQQHLPDSIVNVLKSASSDSLRYRAGFRAYTYFEEINRDSALYYIEKTLLVAKKNNKRLLIARGLAVKGYQLTVTGRYGEALNDLLDAFSIARDPKTASNSWLSNPQSTPEKSRLLIMALIHHMFGVLMDRTQNLEQMVYHFKEARRISEEINNLPRVMLADMNLGAAYISLGKADSALLFESQAKALALKTGQKKYLGFILGTLGDIALHQGDKIKAKQFYYQAIQTATEQNNVVNLLRSYVTLTNFYLAENEKDSSLYFARKTLETFRIVGTNTSQHINLGIAYANLYSSYKLRNQADSAFKYAGLAVAAQDSVYQKRIASLAQFQNLSFREQLRLQNLEKEKDVYQNRIRFYGAMAALLVVAAIVIILWLANKKQQRANRMLKKQKEVIELQAHEVKIEAALERVRGRTMAMQRSEELAEVAFILFEQFRELGEDPDQATIGIINEQERVIEYWVTLYGSQVNRVFKFSIDEPNVTNRIFTAWKAQEKSLIIDLSGKALDEFTTYRAAMGGAGRDEAEQRRVINVAFFSRGLINVQSKSIRPAESIHLLERFATVFEGTYTRFLDLKKAEAQAREAEIELGLERVRAMAMAMQSSNQLASLISRVFGELAKLGFGLRGCSLYIIDESSMSAKIWLISPANVDAPECLHFAFPDQPFSNAAWKAWKERMPNWVYDLKGAEKRAWHEFLFTQTDFRGLPDAVKAAMGEAEQLWYTFSFSNFGGIQTVGEQPLSDDNLDILARFVKVFDLTYTRFNDLKQAEAQAREAKIEAAMERVRSQTMAMRKTDELAETASLVFHQLQLLGAVRQTDRFSISIIDEQTGDAAVWITKPGGQQKLNSQALPMKELEYYNNKYHTWKELPGPQRKNLLIFNELQGAELAAFEKFIIRYTDIYEDEDKMASPAPRLFQLDAYFSHGCLTVTGLEASDAATQNIVKRFASIFEQTYVRFLDLQKAEAQAKEAIKQASVDRVRGQIASMRTTSDLDRITPLIWNELTVLGVPFIRCGVFIIDEQEQLIHTHLSTADGKALATFNLKFDSEGIGQHVLPAWREKQVTTIHWSKEEFAAYTRNLTEQGTVGSKERYVTEHPDTSLDLHFLPFLQGMLYVGNIAPLTQDEMGLVQSLTIAFSTAFARYEDFNKLEAAKLEVEETLTQLKATQTKLIQSEKMASLGELTAGIAHEIQNPLNFVNNFSEVSAELIDEMEAELEKGDTAEAMIIAADIKQNLEKIRHHGKRADGIVKGMLQHSRSASGEKQPTNLNALADEFLRLSYHGLRAKDKSFNADMTTHFDPDLPTIEVISQDIGRVMLNLFNNAFYAVHQKQKTAGAGYRPEVIVNTARENGQVIIRIKDNGSGIPDGIRQKIMQPFFTTKPTGEGTGLGLSISYDIVVKGHGGSIDLVTKENEFTELTVCLPNH